MPTKVRSSGNYRDAPSAAPAATAGGGALPLEDSAPETALAAFEELSAERRDGIVESADHGERLDKLLARRAPEFSRSHLQQLIDQGHVQLDAQVCRQPARRVKAGQTLSVELVPTAQALAFRPEPMSLSVVFEDEHLLVIDKPAGLVVHPGAGNWSGTLLNGLLARDPAAAQLPRAGIVHRLDKGTSGLMVVGKTLPAVTGLVRDIAAREVRREYLALAHGRLEPAQQSFTGSIGRDPGSRLRMAVVASGKPARTDVVRVGHAGGVSALECRLHSGRTHQIRVHLSQAGHPLLSDPLYGGAPGLGLDRPALHAARLGLRHPLSGESLQWTSALPADLNAAWLQVANAAEV